jgi:hypothetical protein
VLTAHTLRAWSAYGPAERLRERAEALLIWAREELDEYDRDSSAQEFGSRRIRHGMIASDFASVYHLSRMIGQSGDVVALSRAIQELETVREIGLSELEERAGERHEGMTLRRQELLAYECARCRLVLLSEGEISARSTPDASVRALVGKRTRHEIAIYELLSRGTSTARRGAEGRIAKSANSELHPGVDGFLDIMEIGCYSDDSAMLERLLVFGLLKHGDVSYERAFASRRK